MTKKASYYNGDNKDGYEASVTLGNTSLHITYQNKTQTLTSEWPVDNIFCNDFSENSPLVLRLGNAAKEYLVIDDTNFAAELRQSYPNAHFHKQNRSFIYSSAFVGLLAMGAVLIGALAMLYFVVLPASAEKMAEQVPEEWEKKLGEMSYSNLVQPASVDSIRTAYINDFYSQLNYKSPYYITVTVVNEDVVNAFALPGGRIVVYKGMLNQLDSYEQLSALLAHETSHIHLKHSTKSIFRSLSASVLLSILFSDAGSAGSELILQADQLKQLGYSRALEEEADVHGLELMKSQNISPNGMMQLFDKLKEQEKGNSTPQFLSTHPLTSTRIETIKQLIDEGHFSNATHPQLDSIWKNLKANSGQ